MVIEDLAIFAVIIFFSILQSIFGIGLLVFGTPTLLMMGYNFPVTLSILLPASFAISVMQVFAARDKKVAPSRYLFRLCVPGIVAGLLSTQLYTHNQSLNMIIGVFLILTALLRFSQQSKKLLVVMLKKYLPLYHFVMGVVHGLTNLGGAFLIIFASGTNVEKSSIRYTVAYYYLIFSIIQILTLVVFMGFHELLLKHAAMAIISSTVYVLVGRRIFSFTNNMIYNHAMSFFIALYGVSIIVKNWPKHWL